MSGLAGMVDLKREGRADAAVVRRMLAWLRHRGSDGEAMYESPDVTLAVSRMSIIDLGGSSQPLYNEDRTVTLVFDGDIYNYRELRDQLKRRNHILTTEGDAETILHLYEDYGLNLFSHLRGMYAFALWDSRTERLVLAVDHLGMKPLYRHERDGKLWFASEIKALFADPATPRRVNLNTLDAYLSFGYMIDEDTLFEGVRRLPPGHALVIETGKPPHLYPFWEFPKPDHDGRRQPDGVVIQTLRDLMAEAVHIHLRSDVPLGLFLNPDLPSAALLGWMAREGGRIQTFTAGYQADSNNALAGARRLADHFQSQHHELFITATAWWRGLERAIGAHDAPLAGASAVTLLLLAEAAARQVKVALTGFGGKALFGGCPAHRAIPHMLAGRRPHYVDSRPLQSRTEARTFTSNPARPRPDSLSMEDAAIRLRPIYDAVFNPGLRSALYVPDLLERARGTFKTFTAIIARSWRDHAHDTAQALIVNAWLAGEGCSQMDTMTMAAGVEARAPFLDPALVKFAASVPMTLRMRDPLYLLREAARPALPDFALEIADISRHDPVSGWLEDDLSGSVRQVLLNPNAFITGFFNRLALERLLKDHFWGRAKQPDVVFRLLTLELWGQRFIRPAVFDGGTTGGTP